MDFSRGSMMSMSFLLTRPNRIASFVVQSGYVPMQSGLNVSEVEVKGKLVVMTHDFEDSSMLLEWSLPSRDLLLHYGVVVTYHNLHMNHTITEESLAAVRMWLEKQL